MLHGLGVDEPACSPAEAELNDADLLERFVARRDEGAFRLLVERHGPMVLDVCRRVLRDEHAAEDAFQAAFLVLVQKSKSLKRPAQMGNWLYGVAYRIAANTRAKAVRRRAHERQAATMPRAEPRLELAWRELRDVLDQELDELPAKYRDALVLCHLQGKTSEEAAELLGCPVGSMSWRLAHGRELLRKRLTRRGLALSAGILALVLSWSLRTTVSHWLLESTVTSALAVAGGHMAGVSPAVLGLMKAGRTSSRASAGRQALLGFALLIAVLVAAIASWLAFAPTDWGGLRESRSVVPASAVTEGCCRAREPKSEPPQPADSQPRDTRVSN